VYFEYEKPGRLMSSISPKMTMRDLYFTPLKDMKSVLRHRKVIKKIITSELSA